MSTEIQVAEVEAQAGKIGEGATLVPKTEMTPQQLDEIFGAPNFEKEKSEPTNSNSEKSKFGGVGEDKEGRLSYLGNESGGLNIDENLRKEMLKADEGKHVLNVDGKEFRYTRNADGVTLYTPDGNFGVRMDNDGKVVKTFNNEKKLDSEMWDKE
ncbi:MAG: hypothetical protein IPG59_04915 [Candidatus Melainabacteria bacterium]|nr:MAG: hypothetical protein IPG59_04915 [Candidatus Melainabacteria bacterium]